MQFPLLDPVKDKLYFFSRENELKVLDIDYGNIDLITHLDCEHIKNAVLVAGAENLIAIKADTDDLLIHNLHTGKTEKVNSEHKA